MKSRFIWGSFILFVVFAVGAYFLPPPFWQTLAVNISTSFFALGLGLIVVNIYLDKASRQGAVISLLQLSDSAIADFHDMFLDLVWSRFSKEEWKQILDGYINDSGDVMTIKPGYRKWVYELARDNQSKIGPKIQELDNSLQEIISLVGWSLDANLLAFALRARNAIRLYRGIPFDDTEEAYAKICEHLIDMDLQSSFVRRQLIELSEIKPD